MFRLHIAVSAIVILGGFSPKQSSLTREKVPCTQENERKMWTSLIGPGRSSIIHS